MLVMQGRWAGHDAHVDAGREHVAVVLACELKTETLADLLEEIGPFAAHGDEFELIAASCERRQMGRDHP